MDSIDTQIQALLNAVEQARQDLQASAKAAAEPWKTNCAFSFGPASAVCNIQVVSLADLKQIVLHLMGLQEKLVAVNEFLGLPEESATEFNGYSIDAWLADCKKRSLLITRKAKEQRLADLEKRANSLVSAETRRQKDLAALLESAKDLLPK